MDSPLPGAVVAFALFLAGWAGFHVLRNRPVGRPLAIAAAALEALLVAFTIVAVVQLVGSNRDFSRATLIGYLFGALAIPPVAVLWSLDEQDRYGTAVLLVAFLVIPVMVLRLQQIWAGPVG